MIVADFSLDTWANSAKVARAPLTFWAYLNRRRMYPGNWVSSLVAYESVPWCLVASGVTVGRDDDAGPFVMDVVRYVSHLGI